MPRTVMRGGEMAAATSAPRPCGAARWQPPPSPP